MTDRESRERLIELVEKAKEEYAGDVTDHTETEYIVECLLNNGVIVPPCKVGDVVYEVQPIRHRTQAYEITTIMWNGHYWWFTWVLKDRNGIYGNVEGFSSHQIGKTVFLTKEEVENTLKHFKNTLKEREKV